MCNRTLDAVLDGMRTLAHTPPSFAAAVAWHPIHSDVLVSGGSEGSILHWSLPDSAPKEVLEFAHDSNVWSLAYHPLGHLLVSASNDHTTRFWSRARPAQRTKMDRFHVGRDKAQELQEAEGRMGGGAGGMNGNDGESLALCTALPISFSFPASVLD